MFSVWFCPRPQVMRAQSSDGWRQTSCWFNGEMTRKNGSNSTDGFQMVFYTYKVVPHRWLTWFITTLTGVYRGYNCDYYGL